MECLACHAPNLENARFCAKCGAPLPMPASGDSDPLIGKTVGGRYRITGILGEGGMGRVYTAEQQMGTNVRRAAVKTLLAQFAKDPQTVARFMRECGTVSELEHPNTIKVYDFGQIEDSGELYIAMELLSGQSMEDALAGGQWMVADRVQHILGQVCGSLQEAHDKGIVHRDLKPANIYLTTRAGELDVVKVLDFGIAKKGASKDSKEQKITQQGTILGTPPYMSPEQFTGKDADHRSDLYALGVVAYEMLTGRLPFEADTPWQWMSAHMSGQPFPLEAFPQGASIPQTVKSAVMRALEKDPARRPQSAKEFFEDLTGGAARLSQVSPIGSSASNPMFAPGGTAPGGPPPAGAARSGQTQIGEPLFPAGAPNAGGGRTLAEAMPLPIASPPTTGGGQVMLAPPPAARAGGGFPVAAVVGIAGLLAVGAGIGFFVYSGKQRTDAESEPTISIPKKKPADTDATPTGEPTVANVLETTSGGSPPTAQPTETTAPIPPPTTTAQPTLPTNRPVNTSKPNAGLDHCCAVYRGTGAAGICAGISARVKSGDLSPSLGRAKINNLGKGGC